MPKPTSASPRLRAASAPRPLLSRAPGPDAPLQLTYTRAAADVSYEVQTTTDLASLASWTSTGVTQGTPDANGLTTATAPVGAGPRFLRLLVTLMP